MKKLILLLLLSVMFSGLKAQYIHKIKADSVLITNDSCNAELNLENRTRHIKGFLYNKGNGRTEFRKAAKLNDSTFILGEDTLIMGGVGNAWSLTGNAGTNPNNHFIGTTDSQALVMRTNNTERMRMTAAGNLIVNSSTADNSFKVQVAGNYSQSGNRIEVNNTTLGGVGNLFQLTSNGTIYSKINNNFATFLGVAAGGNNATILGTSNTGMGYNSLFNIAAASINNSGFGVNTLKNLTTGGHNTAAGVNAGLGITTGSQNTLIGIHAGHVLTTHVINTVVGAVGMSGTNIGGTFGGPVGNENIAVGYNAGGSNKTMAQWIAGPTIYDKCIFLGTRNGKNTASDTLANTTLLGNSLLTDLSNVVVLGNATQNILLTNSNVVPTNSGAKLQIDAPAGHSAFQIRQSYTPASSADPAGSIGTWAWDDNYIYIKTSAGWKRAALSTF